MSDTTDEHSYWFGNMSKDWIAVYAFNKVSRYWQMSTSLQCKSTHSVCSGVEVHTLADLGVTYSPLHNPDSLAE